MLNLLQGLLDDLGHLQEGALPAAEGQVDYFVGCVNHTGSIAAHSDGLVGHLQAAELIQVGAFEGEVLHLPPVNTGEVAGQPFGEGEGQLDRHAHVGHTQLSLDGSVLELHGAVNDALRVYHHLNLLGSYVKEPAGFDYLKPLVHHAGAVDGYLGSHIPIGMLQGHCRRNGAQLFMAEGAEGTSAGRQDDFLNGAAFAHQALEDCAVLAVNRQYGHAVLHAKAGNQFACYDKCFLVEGYLDVLSMHQLGITNVVASSGTALTEGQIRLIRRFTRNVTIMYDGDEAGVKAALRGIDMFLKEGLDVKVILIPDGDDPDSYARKHTLEEVEDFISRNEKDFVDFKGSLLMRDAGNDPLKRASVINDIADTIAVIPDAIKRETYIDFMSRKFDIRRAALEERVSATRAKFLSSGEALAGRPSGPGRVHSRSALRQAQDGAAAEYGLSPETAPAVSELSRGTESRPANDDLSTLEENPIMARAERDLLNFILANGTTLLEFQSDSEFYSGDGEESLTVFEFIRQALDADGIEFANSVYKKTYESYSDAYDEGLSQDEIVKRLLDGADRAIAFVAAQLSTDERYDLTIKGLRDAMMSKGSWLTKYVPKSILIFHACRLEDTERSLKEELKKAQTIQDQDLEVEIMRKLVTIRKAIKTVKVRLGREK